jgi:toxin ParE1/3/4
MAAWTVRLTHQAEQDVEDILTWTEERFGSQQAEIYTEVLTLALEALVEGTDVMGVTKRDDILPGIHVLHVARYGKRGRHYLVFQAREGCHIEVLRILHDSMDLARHLDS